MTTIHINHLDYAYTGSTRNVLDQLTMTLKPGQLNVIIGHNGAGKTTLFDVLTRTLNSSAGIEGFPAERDVLYQVQGLMFPTVLTGYDLFRFFLYTDFRNTIKVGKRPYTDEQMNDTEIDFMHRIWTTRYGSMSVGERRYLSILAMTLMERKLYIFDEPTSGVDPEARVRVLNRLQLLANDPSKLVILSTHTLHELKSYRCQIYALHRGQCTFEGTYDEFLTYFGSDDPDIAFSHMIHQRK